jgi:hypothetical protein
VGCQPSAARVWELDEGWSVAKMVPRGPVGLRRHRLDRYAEPAADDRRDVTHRDALVSNGVPRGAGWCLLEGEAEQHGGVEGVDGRPPLAPVAGVARHTGPAGDVGEDAGEAALAVVVHGAGQADGRAAHAA